MRFLSYSILSAAAACGQPFWNLPSGVLPPRDQRQVFVGTWNVTLVVETVQEQICDSLKRLRGTSLKAASAPPISGSLTISDIISPDNRESLVGEVDIDLERVLGHPTMCQRPSQGWRSPEPETVGAYRHGTKVELQFPANSRTDSVTYRFLWVTGVYEGDSIAGTWSDGANASVAGRVTMFRSRRQ